MSNHTFDSENASPEHRPHTAVFWDIENVHDEPETHERLTKEINEHGIVLKSYAFADWDSRRSVAVNLYNLGYDLIHVPDTKDNAADYKMAAYIMEHMIRYPETKQYVMISGDGDFKILAGAIRERGLYLWVISNPIITASELTDLATKYSDIHSFRPSRLPCSTPEDCEKLMGNIDEMRHLAAARLQEAIITIQEAGNRPGIGHVKHVMMALNPTFSERVLGFRTWNEFLDWAEYEEYVRREGELPGTILVIPETTSPEKVENIRQSKEAFKTLCRAVEEQLDLGIEPTLKDIKKSLDEQNVDYASFGYPTLADFILAAEKRGFVRVLALDDETPVIVPDVTVDRVRAWFEENVNKYFGESAKVPKREFLEKIANLLVNSRTSLQRLESYLEDKSIRQKYEGILSASDLLFLPPFQMSMVHVLFGQGLECEQVVEKVNVELSPLGITLKCP